MEVKHGTLGKVGWNLCQGQRSVMITLCRVQLKDRKRAKNLMLLLGLSETTGQ